MAIELKEEDGLLVVNVSGKLAAADYERFVPEFDRLVQKHGKLRLLFDMTGFHGWETAALWADIKFDAKHFADIERLAMVGEKNGSTAWLCSASHSRPRKSDSSIMPIWPRRASGSAANSRQGNP